MIPKIYRSELKLNRANSSDTAAPFLDLDPSISDGIISSKIYDKRNDFDFNIVNFAFLDGAYILFAPLVSTHVDDLKSQSNLLTAKLIKQGYLYHKLWKAVSKLYRRHSELVNKYKVH